MNERLATALSGRYHIERELGAGGMATVYLAEDLKHDRKVAIKVLKPELAAVLGAERFVVEIKTTAAMSHPHILPLFDSGTADGFLFYVMPYIQGETIREKLNRETQFGVDEAVRIAREVADALDYAHRHGVIHRDIKPENILLHDGRAMVMDFGIALAVSAAAGGRMTETGLSLGTPHYMSPEQATAEKEITARSDQYSLASVLYEMLAGEPPHTAGNAQAVIMKIITDVARPMHELRRNVPANVNAALAKALEKLPADRFESARAFADALANAHYSGDGSGHIASGTRARPASLALRAIPWGTAALAAAVALYFGWRMSVQPVVPELRLTLPTPGAVPDIDSRQQSVAVSPDGRAVAYIASGGGVNRVYLRELAGRATVALAGSDGAHALTFSPDSRWVLFSTLDRRVMKAPVDGGAASLVARTNSPVGLAWSEKLGPVFGMIAFSNTYTGLTTVGAAQDTALRRLTEIDRGMDHWPVAVGDGSSAFITRVSFTTRRERAPGSRLALAHLEGGDAEEFEFVVERPVGVADGILLFLDPEYNLMAVALDGRGRPTGGAIRVSDGSVAIASAWLSPSGVLAVLSRPSAYQAILVDDRGAGTPIMSDTITRFAPRFSPDGRRIVFNADRGRNESTWIYELATGALSKSPNSGSAGRLLAEWTSDSRQLLGTRGGTLRTFSADAADSGTALTSEPRYPLSSVSVAPDRRSVALSIGFSPTGADVLVRTVGGDTSSVRLAATEANERAPRISPDGRWIAYESDEPGRFEVYVQSYPTPGARLQVSDAGGMSPVWSKDGTRLYYRAGGTVMVADLASGAQRSVVRRQALFTAEMLTNNWLGTPTFDVSPDGKRVVLARAVQGGAATLEVWTGWIPAIKRRLAAGK